MIANDLTNKLDNPYMTKHFYMNKLKVQFILEAPKSLQHNGHPPKVSRMPGDCQR